MREVQVHAQLKHVHILRLISHEKKAATLTMVLELCRGPELQHVLDARGARSHIQ